MASVINQSNNNSSLVATLMEAQESVVNPFIYNISKQTKFHGIQYVEESPENGGNAGAGKSVDFNISKFGFLRSAIFKWTTTSPASTNACPRTGLINCIDRIEILSSSRRLAVMDKYALMCAISDLPRDVQQSYYKGLHMSSAGTQIQASVYTSFLNLPFSFFNNVKNAIPVSFVEPIKVRVYFSDLAFCNATDTAKVLSVSDPKLLCEFRVLDNADEDATIQENYDGVLTQLNYDYETEVGESGTLTEHGELTLSKTLSTNVVASDIYVIVSADYSQQASTPTGAKLPSFECPLQIKNIEFQGSGQNIVPQIDGRYLEYYGRRCDKSQLHTLGTCPQSSNDDPAHMKWVYKIQLGLGDDKRMNTGGISLREINAPTIKVNVMRTAGAVTTGSGVEDTQDPDTLAVDNRNSKNLDDAKVTLRVVVRHHTLVSTDPSSGRLTNMLTN